MSKGELNRLVLKSFLEQQFSMLTALAPVAYMIVLIMGLPSELAWKVSIINATVNSPAFGMLLPWLLMRSVLKNALAYHPQDKPGDRLTRILKAPRKIEMGVLLGYAVSCTLWGLWPTLVYDLNPAIIPLVVVSFLLLAMVVGIRLALRLERVLRPYALEEFHKYPNLRLEGSGFLWPKQRWYLPYCFALFVLATLTVTGIIIAKKAQTGFGDLFAKVEQVVTPEVMVMLRAEVANVLNSMVVPVAAVGGFLILAAAWCAWELARHQHEGTTAVQQSIESIASGTPVMPKWVSTDEVGDLSSATASVFEKLRAFAQSLSEAAQMLGHSAEQLASSTKGQTETLSVQAAALQETQVTAQEIKETSLVAAQRAEGVLKQAERGDQLGRAGEVAIEQSLHGLRDIQQQVLEMAANIRSLDERARQIATITQTVKSLADRSNMLALNAAIEAVRSGEHGKGFSVVAREIRNLADQSIRATISVRDILEDLSGAIRNTADMSERGSDAVRNSVSQVEGFGDNIRQLSGIVRDNVSAVRQISAAVTQQNTGIAQIFQAVNDLTKLMDQTMVSLRFSDEAGEQMRTVGARVSGFVEQYGWQKREGSEQVIRHLSADLPLAGASSKGSDRAA